MNDPFEEVSLAHLAPNHIHEIPIEQLSPHPRNAEIYSDNGIDPQFMASLINKGIITPLIVTAKGIVVCGHRRLQHATHINQQSEGMRFKTVPCIVDHSLRTEEQILLTLIQDNIHQRRDVTAQERWNELKIMNDLMRVYACLRAFNGGREFVLADIAGEIDVDNPKHARLLTAIEHLEKLGDNKTSELAEIYNKHYRASRQNSLYMAALSLGMDCKQADRFNQIQGAIAWYREHGMPEKADELQRMFSSSDAREIKQAAKMAKAAYIQFRRINDPQRISKSPGSVDLKIRQVVRTLSTMRLQLDYEGGIIVQRILDDIERLPAHVVHGGGTVAEAIGKGRTRQGIAYLPQIAKVSSEGTD